MSAVSMTFGRPARLAVPRGAYWFAMAAAALINGVKRFDQWLLERRAREANDAEEVLALAARVEASDPGFASDLRGAVMRSVAKRDLV